MNITEEIVQGLSNEIENFIVVRRDDKHEKYLSSKPEIKKGVTKRGINARLITIVEKLNKKEAELIKKRKKTAEDPALAFQLKKREDLLGLLPPDFINTELSELQQEYTEFLFALNKEHSVEAWLNEFTPKAKDINFATHIPKLSHSSSKGTSVLDNSTCQDNGYLTTNTLEHPNIDTAVDNAASTPIGTVLQLKHQGITVLDCVKENVSHIFSPFTSNEEQKTLWLKNLSQAFNKDKKQSCFLLKQVFFPRNDGDYDLLLPLTSSSLAQAIHSVNEQNINHQKEINKTKKKADEKYAHSVVSFPQKAKLNITASNHSNVSTLNNKRSGKMLLFNAAPPQWQNRGINFQLLDKNGLFYHLSHKTRQEVNALKTYLKLLNNKELSQSHPNRAAAITEKLHAIFDVFFDEIMMANMTNSPNWTCESNLPLTYQLLFEPAREDADAKEKKMTNSWMSEICQDFARWLNKELKSKQLQLSTIHSELWAKIFASELRRFIATQEANL